jgi:hypothetical protein
LLLGVLALAGFAACGDNNPAESGEDLGEIGGIATKHTDPVALLAAHARAISEKNLAAYEAMLMPPGDGLNSFHYCPTPEDVDDLPWMQGSCWGYETEIGIMTNMFDENYSSPNAEAVQTIDMDISVGAITEPGDGTTVVDCVATILVMLGPNDGFFTDTRLLFTLESYGECLRIRKIQEIPRQKAQGGGLRDDPPEMPTSSWAHTKALYRQ